MISQYLWLLTFTKVHYFRKHLQESMHKIAFQRISVSFQEASQFTTQISVSYVLHEISPLLPKLMKSWILENFLPSVEGR